MIKDLIQAQKNYYLTPSRPLMAVLYITSRCNLRCSFCEMGDPSRPVNKDLSTDELKDIIRQLAEWKVRKLYLTGGEPFMRKDIWDILSYCDEYGVRIVRLTTNGTLFRKISGDQLHILKDSVSALCISLDSARVELHDEIRGVQGTYNKIFDFLKSFDRGLLPQIYFSAVITKGNLREIGNIIQLAYDNNVKHINFQPLNFESNFPGLEGNEDKKQLIIDNEEIEQIDECIKSAIGLAKDLNVSTNLDVLVLWIKEYFKNIDGRSYFFDKVLKNHVCSKPFNYIHINYYGDLWACSMIGTGKNIVGKDIKSVWQELAREYRDILNKKHYFKKCYSCFCDFPTNFRESLIYHPVDNYRSIIKLASYYLRRTLSHR